MDFKELILTRRSIRKFTDQKVSQNQINEILQAAMYAPSARNEQPWHFIVVDDKAILAKIAIIHPYAQMLNEAPLALVVCADEKLEKSSGYWSTDCAAATQNILLSAHALGLGSVWLGVYPREERMHDLSNLFLLPQNILPFSIVAIGYPNEIKEHPQRFNTERIHYNNW